MSQTLKQTARRRAAQQFQKRREEHLAHETRIKDLVVEATTALLERERVISLTEHRIAAALCELEELTVTTADAAALCGLEPREVAKLKRNHDEEPEQPNTHPADEGPTLGLTQESRRVHQRPSQDPDPAIQRRFLDPVPRWTTSDG